MKKLLIRYQLTSCQAQLTTHVNSFTKRRRPSLEPGKEAILQYLDLKLAA
jgi:hypothetical protein